MRKINMDGLVVKPYRDIFDKWMPVLNYLRFPILDYDNGLNI